MLNRLARAMMLACLMCGLCASARANTTAAAAGNPATSLALAPQPAISPTPAVEGNRAMATPAPATPAASVQPVRIALLLPLQSEIFANAAQAVRAGFQAAYERESAGIEIALIETGDGSRPIDAVYADAQTRFDVIVGPLARADVAAVAQSGKVGKPTVALANPDTQGDAEVVLPPAMLSVGLSIEDEARQVAGWAASGRKTGKAFVISSSIAWQRRAARAFALQWQQRGLEAQTIEISVSSGYIGAASLVQLKKRLQEEHPGLLFVALDDVQARQLLQLIGHDAPVYGTSQLNPLSLNDWRIADGRPEMNGVRLVDIPWQLQPDHPAVMVYPRPTAAADQKPDPNLERLYALGIDAFRIAREIGLQRKEFELDGVTGKLSVKFGKGTAVFRRSEQPAAYIDGAVAPIIRNP